MIQMENVCFEYKVHTPVLNGINAQIYKGDVVGILGHNGAGKTTLFRILLDLFKPSEGVVKVDAMKRELGYVPEEAGIYLNLSAMQNMMFRADINHISSNNIQQDIMELLYRVQLDDRIKDSKVVNWSNGMKKRLALTCSLIIGPKILFLDEPTNGLDPESLKIFLNILEEENKKGMTILINSHDLHTISKICNRIMILQKGQKIYESYDFKENLEALYFEMVNRRKA